MSVLIETTIGDLVFDLYTDERPRSTLNFLKLCKIKYFNFCLFHSVRRNFIAQCGDPTSTGRGGESIYSHIYGDQAKYFDLETKPRIKHKTKGTISFVNNGNDKHGSQFFITMGEGLDFLDGKHTIFGMLAEGFDTLEKLNETICDDNHKPYQDVRITHTVILYDPYDDPKGLVIPEGSPEPTKEQLESCRIGADEDLEAEKNKPVELINKELEEKEFQIGTKILETVGDIDNTDEKPPENVLFVCKLNPVTNADDLKVIFSRFGKICSCEIIKDIKTGDSLCYGFVEFKYVAACEKAYFKMDNVMIDDRRIHVDFCQSIAKVKKWRNSSAFQKRAKEASPPPKESYELKSDKTNRERDKYAMVFDEETSPNVKPKRKISRDSIKEKPRRKYASEDEQPRRVSEPKPKKMMKESRKRKTSYSSDSGSERERSPVRETKGKKKSEYENERVEVKKKARKERMYESDLSSDEEVSRRDRKKKNDEKRVEHIRNDEIKVKKKSQKKEKKSRYSDSEDEVEKPLFQKTKKKKRTEDNHSEVDDYDSNLNTKKSKKEKYPEKKKKKTYESEDEDEKRSYRADSKQRSRSKQSSKGNHSRARSVEDSDSEGYEDTRKRNSSMSRKKHSKAASSDESSGDERKVKTSRSYRRPVSSNDERSKKTHKKLPSKKKSRKRHDTSESDSSEYSR